MTPVSCSSVLEALTWRYATKSFDPARKIPNQIWTVLEQALVLSPSSFGLQPWKFIVVQDPTLRTQLSACSWGQTQPIDCSHYVVFTYRRNLGVKDVDRFINRTAEVRSLQAESLKAYRDIVLGSVEAAKSKGYLDLWQSRQVYIALGQFMSSAALLGVDTCPLEGLDAGKYDEILGIDTSEWGTVCACAAGYRTADDKYAKLAKVRYPTQDVVLYK